MKFQIVMGVPSLPRHFLNDRRVNLDHRDGCAGRRLADHARRIRPQGSIHRVTDISRPHRAWRSDGRVAVNNQTMGGESGPWEGQGRSASSQETAEREREFTYNEAALWKPACLNVRRDDLYARPAATRPG